MLVVWSHWLDDGVVMATLLFAIVVTMRRCVAIAGMVGMV
jgi:hypothetical protein